jgi:hypothetical protein
MVNPHMIHTLTLGEPQVMWCFPQVNLSILIQVIQINVESRSNVHYIIKVPF